MSALDEAFPRHEPCRTVLTSQTTVEEDLALDLSDLDLLDDELRHGRCISCGGGTGCMKLGVPFIAMCGKRAIWTSRLAEFDRPTPTNACPVCLLRLRLGPCPVLQGGVGMSARVEAFETSHTGTLIGAPDLERRRDGRWFLAERFHVRSSTKLGTWVWVEGRAVKVDGSIGNANRGEGYDLDDSRRDQDAPAWLVDALKEAGVTW